MHWGKSLAGDDQDAKAPGGDKMPSRDDAALAAGIAAA